MKKRIFRTLIALLLVVGLVAIPNTKADAAYRLKAKFVITDGLLRDYRGGSSTVKIPTKVKEIGFEAFSGNKKVKKIVIPKTVKKINQRAFYDCPNLKEIVIGSGVTTIDESAFAACPKLAKIKLNSGVTSVGIDILKGTKWLKNNKKAEFVVNNGCLLAYNGKGGDVVVPATVTSIADRVFYKNKKIKSITFEGNLKWIGKESFYACKKLERVDLPASFNRIGTDAFVSCSKLREMNFANEQVFVSGGALKGTPYYKSFKPDENGFLIINGTLEKYTGSKTSVVIPDGVRNIGRESLMNNKKATKFTIPQSVIEIEDNAFHNCSKMKQITIPGSVIAIGMGAFSECMGLKKVVVKNGTKNIGENAFYRCKKLVKVTLPKSISSIHYSAFYQCNKKMKIYCKKKSVAAKFAASNMYKYTPS